ncbi:Desulfoferrodoxin ferrous iron-binding region [Methanocaldococcus villosus KIN24-T80]|uniref:Desulfoferrodoxin ferrous iron-binding region n=1 Tax=Methanocaldococcus villosus KIN24-T80 TaxID=1069083 RepID=N6VYJ2_9EURY|nr:class II SORL domain-containing protein [Methanocaldococcus villosus]ENN96192.1 Desulfoferrodoxin ferrous iron-binding region [Methanocaldococcus villosus KIN24-T80]
MIVNVNKNNTDFERKHAPKIECKDVVKVNEIYEVKLYMEVEHPMEKEHYIQYIELYAEDYPLAKIFLTPYAKPEVTLKIKAPSEGHEGREFRLIAYAYCNLHGIWKSEKKIKIEG